MMKRKKPIKAGSLRIRRAFLGVLLLVLAFPVKAQNAGAPWAELEKAGMIVFSQAQKIPSFTVQSPENKAMELSDYLGSYVFLNFWATWCPPCLAEMPSIQRFSDYFKGKGLTVLAVSVGENIGTVKAFLSKNPYTFLIGVNANGSLGQLYASRGIPSTYILDPQGRVIAACIGSRTWDDPRTLGIFSRLVGSKN
jgi:thiol-disulfide isomerase/thioredoxin